MTDFFKSKITKNVASVFSAGYLAFVVWLIYISCSYVFAFPSFKLLYTVYIIINLLFGALMFYTRKEIFTDIIILLSFPANLVLTIISVELGNWALFIPPLVINCAVFIFTRFKYTTKILVAILTIVMFVLGILAYIVFYTLFGNLPLYNFSDSTRVDEVASPNSVNRYVVYERIVEDFRKLEIYAEPTKDDIDLKIVTLKKQSDDRRIYSSREPGFPEIVWQDDNTLTVNGQVKVIDVNIK